MFTASVETQFWAAHQLTLADGRKEPCHAHNWSVIADVSSNKLNSMGLVIDFGKLKATIDNIVAELGNPAERDFNKIGYFRQNNSSAEMVAKYIYEKLTPKLPDGIELTSVKVVEQQGCSVKFSRL